MPLITEMIPSRFLRKEDVADVVVATIDVVEKMDVALEGAVSEYKFAMSFDELEKPLILNAVNARICASIFGSPNSADWKGKQVMIYTDPTVFFGGRVVGGIRLRAAPTPTAAPRRTQKVKPPAAARPSREPGEDFDEDVAA